MLALPAACSSWIRCSIAAAANPSPPSPTVLLPEWSHHCNGIPHAKGLAAPVATVSTQEPPSTRSPCRPNCRSYCCCAPGGPRYGLVSRQWCHHGNGILANALVAGHGLAAPAPLSIWKWSSRSPYGLGSEARSCLQPLCLGLGKAIL
ncbi:hypothetical protein HNY73_009219 [Argiope bruennichi]|uniref:Uncharacterized protein n=1 Tax=Argiope bruennichi TaxID=94029 RepID=A0A8T0F9T2_ARGBR|nr:hypothetical protein HNY73_009219 [Argiope bruennichi]